VSRVVAVAAVLVAAWLAVAAILFVWPHDDEPITGRADAVVFSIFDALQITGQGLGDVSLPEPILRNPATLAVARKPGNAGFINFLTNWVLQQRSLGLAQGKLARSWESRGIDLSILPPGFSF